MKQKKSSAEKILRELVRPFYQLSCKMWAIASESKNQMSQKEIAQDKANYTRLNTDKRFVIDSAWDYLCLGDKYAQNGGDLSGGNGQYFIQDIWGARKVLEHKPSVHYDVGSSIKGFIAHLLAQKQKIILLDIRPMDNQFNTDFLSNGGGDNILSRKCYPIRKYRG